MKKLTILLFAAVALGSGCKKFTNINQNPNQPLNVTPNVLLSAALVGSGSAVGTEFYATTRWMGYWSRSGNYIADNQTEGYSITTGYEDGDFTALYGVLNRYNNVENAAKASPATLAFYVGVAQTMKALHFSTLVDGFGNIPYSQAFNINKYPNPKYDDAQTIYTNLLSQLDSAVTYFNTAAAYYASGGSNTTDDQYDVMFGRGQGTKAATRIAKWIAFANTVKLKLLMNEQAAISGNVAAEIAKITANGGGFLTAGTQASINPGYSTAQTAQMSPLFGAFYNTALSPTTTQNYYRANNYALNFYSNTGDTFRPVLVYAPISGTTVAGNYDGDPAATSNSGTSGVGSGILKSASQDQLIMSDFESLFTQAEATARGYLTGGPSAATLLKQAIEQNFIYLGDNAGDADAYISGGAGNPLVDITAPDVVDGVDLNANGIETIMTQKWIALNGVNWFQAYTDYRRTGFPRVVGGNKPIFGVSHAENHVTNNGKVEIPFRFLYPQSEINTNGQNVPALSKAQYTPIFWDKREQ